MANPGAVIGEWRAAGLLGLWTDWPDTAPTVLYAERGAKGDSHTTVAVEHPLRPVFRRRPADLHIVHPDPLMPELRVVGPATTAVQCLDSILSGRHTWRTLAIPGIRPRMHQAIQFVDAFTQCTWLTFDEIRDAATGRIPADVVRAILASADYGAHSPMETAMRLIVRDLLPPGHTWESQVTGDLDGVPFPGGTVPDLACRELRIALYYDGGHHDSLRQRETDLQLTQQMINQGWEVCRYTRHGIRRVGRVRRDVGAAIGRAEARWRSTSRRAS
ncbi:MAG: DUF559 domain-containing protein [Corynebacterium sp.]|uniref:DUF559 domain-containing protein n=1 Tax=Corynebacterium sp. TaxID=1720 RepID=UPI003F94944E